MNFPRDAFYNVAESREYKTPFRCDGKWCEIYRACIGEETIENDQDITISRATAREIIVPIRMALQSYELLTNPAALEVLNMKIILDDLETDLHCNNPFLIYLSRFPFEKVEENYSGLTGVLKKLYPKQVATWAGRVPRANVHNPNKNCNFENNMFNAPLNSEDGQDFGRSPALLFRQMR